jgi:Zn-dependent peptidase ImmA (M78 family)
MIPRITDAALSQMESGRIRPSASTLVALADALNMPERFFSTQLPAGLASTRERPPFWDIRMSCERDRKQARALALLVADLVAVTEIHVRLPELVLPVCPAEPESEEADVEFASEVVRLAWGNGNDPIPQVVRELERHGIPVARLPSDHGPIDSFAVDLGRRPIIVLTGRDRGYVQARLDAAHELGHLVMHRASRPAIPPMERQAHDFACAFLLPRSKVRPQLPTRLDQGGWARLAELKRTWGVPISALLHRARQLGSISTEVHRRAVRRMSIAGWEATEPGDQELGPQEAPHLLGRALHRAEASSRKDLTQLLADAGLPEPDLRRVIEASTDRRPQLQL